MENKEILDESIYNLEQSNFNNAIIQDNKIIFIYGEKTYRVRTPIQSEQALMDNKRNLAQLEYMQQEGCITRKQLVAKLKSVGIFDLEDAENRRDILIRELKQLWFLLAPKSSENKVAIAELTKKIAEIETKLKELAIEISTHLSPCLENRLEKFTLEYLSFLCTDIQINGNWERAWKTIEDYQAEDNSLVDRATANLSWLLLNRKT